MYSVFEEFPKGWGVQKIRRKWKILGGGGGSYVKFPPWWGYGYFLELHISLVSHQMYISLKRLIIQRGSLFIVCFRDNYSKRFTYVMAIVERKRVGWGGYLKFSILLKKLKINDCSVVS